MSRFYGDLKGGRGMATRQGTTNSGIAGHIRGWDFGAQVYCYVNKDGDDEIQVLLTGGSASASTLKGLGRFIRTDKGIEKVSEF